MERLWAGLLLPFNCRTIRRIGLNVNISKYDELSREHYEFWKLLSFSSRIYCKPFQSDFSQTSENLNRNKHACHKKGLRPTNGKAWAQLNFELCPRLLCDPYFIWFAHSINFRIPLPVVGAVLKMRKINIVWDRGRGGGGESWKVSTLLSLIVVSWRNMPGIYRLSDKISKSRWIFPNKHIRVSHLKEIPLGTLLFTARLHSRNAVFGKF